MRLIPAIIFLIFACTAYAYPMFGKDPGQESSVTRKVKEKLGLARKTPPPADVQKPGPSEAIKKFIETKTYTIAEKPGEFQIWKSLSAFEKDTHAVIKIIPHGIDQVKSEMEHWAEAGYLLAYATRGKSTTYLILFVNVPVTENQRMAEHLMVNAMVNAERSRFASGVKYETPSPGYEYRENFLWKNVHGKGWFPSVFDWVNGWNVRSTRPKKELDKIDHVELSE